MILIDRYLLDAWNWISKSNFSEWLNALYILTVVILIYLIIRQKGDPLKTISWSMVIILLPVAGIVLYVFFGQNYRKQKIFSRKGLRRLQKFGPLIDEQFREISSTFYGVDPELIEKKLLMTLSLKSSKSLVTTNNRVTILNNGRNTFDAILADLQKATHHIHLDYYIIEADKIGNEIAAILIDKASQGVQVRLIYDDVGCWGLSESYLEKLQNGGVQIYPFLPVRFPRFTNKINYRNHRKILVIDGKVGYVGGINIADRYIEGDEQVGLWRDTHLRLEGDAVRQLQLTFLTDWYFVSGQVLKESVYFKRTPVKEQCLVQIVASGPDSDWSSIMQVYFYAISSARHHVYISTPYFLPNESILTALKTVALSGVDVQIMLPSRSDSHIVYWSSLSYVSELLDAGIKVLFYNKGFNHGKLLMVDSIFVSVGTANMDIRSFDQNFEVNALLYDKEKALQFEAFFEEDSRECSVVTRKEWDARSDWHNIRESFARLLSPLF